MKLKEKFALIREEKPYKRYLLLLAVNFAFFVLVSIPCFFTYSEKVKPLAAIAVYTVLFIFSVVYGFLSVEITDNIIWGNLIFALFGGFYGAFIADKLLEISTTGNVLYCIYFFLRYSLMAFFVSLVIKNTRK